MYKVSAMNLQISHCIFGHMTFINCGIFTRYSVDIIPDHKNTHFINRFLHMYVDHKVTRSLSHLNKMNVAIRLSQPEGRYNIHWV